jgi:hypothetical protein
VVDDRTAEAEKFWSEYARGMYGVPRAWAHKAENLIHAFEAVSAASIPGSLHADLRDQALMLAGMATEVLLKATIVTDEASRASVTAPAATAPPEARALRRIFFSHNLRELAGVAGLALSEADGRVADALSQYVYWRGRYVVPTERAYDDLIPIVGLDGLVNPKHISATVESARALVAAAKALVHARLYARA